MDADVVLTFLKGLKKNNHKTWFDKHRDDYETAKREFESFVEDLIRSVSEFDPDLSSLRPKDCVFRIFRDVRFSKDKTPYKTNFGAFLGPGGRKTTKAGYYIHVEAGGSMLGGGIYMPEPDVLLKLRRLIANDGRELELLMKAPSFRKYYKGLEEMEGEKLKTMPKGFDPGHRYADWLKFKSFVVMHPLPDRDVVSGKFLSKVTAAFRAMQPFNEFLSSVF